MILRYEGYPLHRLMESAMITTEKKGKTSADYAALDEGAPYQLIDGELVMTPAPTFFHQLAVWRLGTDLLTFVERNQLGVVVGSPVDVYFSETETYQPDLVLAIIPLLGPTC